MPYTIRKGTGTKKWKIINKITGKVVGSSTNKFKARASIGHRMKAHKKIR